MKNFSFIDNWWQFLLIAIICYFVGCFNFALFISRAKKSDITKIGSGNPGTMNMAREFGFRIGFLTFLCDALKGGMPALITFYLYKGYIFEGTLLEVSDFIRYFCGVFVVIGHIYPITMKGKGGKGIASSLGVFWFSLACQNPWWWLLGFLFFGTIILYIFLFEWGSMGSFIAVGGFSIIQMCFLITKYGNYPVNAYLVGLYLLIACINVLVWWAHRKNVLRLFSGEEHRTSLKKIAKKKAK